MKKIKFLAVLTVTLFLNSSGFGQPVTTTIGGTANRVPLFTTATNIENSIILQSGTTTASIGTASPNTDARFDCRYEGADVVTTGANYGIMTTVEIDAANNHMNADTYGRLAMGAAYSSRGYAMGVFGATMNVTELGATTGTCEASGGRFSVELETPTIDNQAATYYLSGVTAFLTGDISTYPDNGAVSAIIGVDEIVGTNTWAGYFDGRGYFSGDVGIGTTSPGFRLEVVNTSVADMVISKFRDSDSRQIFLVPRSSDNAFGNRLFNTNDMGIVYSDNSGINSTAGFVIGPIENDKPLGIKITDDGYIGINEPSPTEALHVAQNCRVDAYTGLGGAPQGSYRLYVHGNSYFDGDCGIGRAPAVNPLEVEGTASKTVAGDWLANSDKRIKTDIEDIDNSFEILMKLHPVKFKYTNEWKRLHPSIKDHYYYNFIAQEYKEVFPESVQGSGEYLEGEDKEILQMESYSAQIFSIKAVQELINRDKEKNEKIAQLERTVEDLNISLSARLDAVEDCINSLPPELCGASTKNSTNIQENSDVIDNLDGAKLFQNQPNPFDEQTEIKYYLPENVTQAEMFIFDMQGKQIKRYELTTFNGNGKIIINGGELTPGMFFYSLIANGKEVSTKRMIITE